MTTTFTPKTYTLGQGLPERGALAKCPGCGVYVNAFRLVDVLKFPEHLTRGVQWVCDGCREGWIRNSVPVGSGEVASEATFARYHGAPPDVVKNLEAVVAKRIANNPAMSDKHAAARENARKRKPARKG